MHLRRNLILTSDLFSLAFAPVILLAHDSVVGLFEVIGRVFGLRVGERVFLLHAISYLSSPRLTVFGYKRQRRLVFEDGRL